MSSRAVRTRQWTVSRGDGLVRIALAAVAHLEALCGPLGGAGVVVGTAMATLETNALFAARIRERGASSAEPRRFAYTSPNTVAGEASIAFGLNGPSFAVGGGMHAALEALAVGALLVEAGDADRVVVVAADDVGPATRALAGNLLRTGAVAVLLDAQRGESTRARVGAITLRRGEPVVAASPGHAAGLAGHMALLPLVDVAPPPALVCASPPDVLARVALERV
jgi:3-oxoacyl-[acyl-carrier-protein] synthase II